MENRASTSAPKRPKGETRELVKAKNDRGMSPREIGVSLGISTQAVYQHLTALKAETEEASA